MRPWFAMPGVGRIVVIAASFVLASCSASAPAATPARSPAVPVSSPALSTTAPASSSPVALPSPSAAVVADPWRVVAVGDSIPFNSPDDCFGCTGFVSGYALRLERATGHPVSAINLSQHNGLQASGLAPELAIGSQRADEIANADVVIVSIGHNDAPWNVNDDACDGAREWDDPIESNVPFAAKYTKACAEASAIAYQPKLAAIYKQIVALREGKPTVFLALDTYNDLLSWCEERGCDNGTLKITPPEIVRAARVALEPWNRMICDTAEAAGMQCADVYHLFGGPDAKHPAGALLAQDYTHPSQLGNDKIADYLLTLGYGALTP